MGKEGKEVVVTISIHNMDSTLDNRGAFSNRRVVDSSKVVLIHNILVVINFMVDKILQEDGPHTREVVELVGGPHNKVGVVRVELIPVRHQH